MVMKPETLPYPPTKLQLTLKQNRTEQEIRNALCEELGGREKQLITEEVLNKPYLNEVFCQRFCPKIVRRREAI